MMLILRATFIFLLCFLCACASDFGGENNSSMKQGRLTGAVVQQVTGKGIVIDINLEEQAISISHAPIPEMNWPPMLMVFKVAESVSVGEFKKDDRVFFDLEIDAEKNYRVSDVRLRSE